MMINDHVQQGMMGDDLPSCPAGEEDVGPLVEPRADQNDDDDGGEQGRKGLDGPLVAGCSITHKPRPLYVHRWEKVKLETESTHQVKFFSSYVDFIFVHFPLSASSDFSIDLPSS